MTHLQFAQPHWLWVGALSCAALVALFVRAARLRRRALTALAGPRCMTTASRGRRATKQALTVLGTAATFMCLARPLGGFRWEEDRQEGTDVMFAVDTSKSMLTRDIRPDRLTRAKLAVSDLLREFPDERAGLIAFAGDAFVLAPMTIDHEVFGEALDALDTNVIARGGTDVAAPIRTAIEAMATEPDRHKVLVLLSDGEDLKGEALSAARDAARAGVVIYAVGVGTPAGDLVPAERDGAPDVARDADGHAVHSKLDEQALMKIASATGGAYAALGPSGHGLEGLYREHLAQLPRRAVTERTHKVYTERFQMPLAVAIACLLLELALGERRRRWFGTNNRSAPESSTTGAFDRRPGTRGAAVVGMLGLALLALRPRATEAAERRETPARSEQPSVSTYNEGTAAYRKKDFSSAQQGFEAATHTTDLSLQEDAYYDLGNARYRVGQATLAKDRAATIVAWKSAVAAYGGALALAPKDGDARFNHDLVQRRLAALEQQERQEQDQKKQKGDQGQNPRSSKDQNQKGEQKQQAQADKQGRSDQQDQPSRQNQPQNGPQKGPQKGEGKEASQDPHGQAGQGAKQDLQSQENGKKPPNQQSSEEANGRRQEAGGGPSGAGAPTASAKIGTSSSQPTPSAETPHQGPGQTAPQGKPDLRRAARRDPGGLTASEAEQLLDSATGDLRRMPVAVGRRPETPTDEAPVKDW